MTLYHYDRIDIDDVIHDDKCPCSECQPDERRERDLDRQRDAA